LAQGIYPEDTYDGHDFAEDWFWALTHAIVLGDEYEEQDRVPGDNPRRRRLKKQDSNEKGKGKEDTKQGPSSGETSPIVVSPRSSPKQRTIVPGELRSVAVMKDWRERLAKHKQKQKEEQKEAVEQPKKGIKHRASFEKGPSGAKKPRKGGSVSTKEKNKERG
jgi:hypothetical protein